MNFDALRWWIILNSLVIPCANNPVALLTCEVYGQQPKLTEKKLGFCLRQGIISCSQPFPVPRSKQCQALTQAYFPPRQLEGFAIIILQKHSRKEPKRLQTTNRCKPILTLSSDFLKIQVHILFYNSIKTLCTRKARVRVFKIGVA